MDLISRYYKFIKWLIEKNKHEIMVASILFILALSLTAIILYFDTGLLTLVLIILSINLIFFGFGVMSYDIKYHWSKFNKECPPDDVRIINRLKGK